MTARREHIMDEIVSTLQSISTGNGYHNTIRSVARYEQFGNDEVDVPFIEVLPVEESYEPSPNPCMTCKLVVDIDVWIRHDKAEFDGSTDAYLITLIADVYKALMADTTRGGYAVETKPVGNHPFVSVVNNAYSGVAVMVEITYRHSILDTET